MNSEDIVKRLEDATNEWVISHNGAKENSCGLVALAREAANLIEYLQAQLAESQRREQAAIRDLRDNAYRSCYVCKNWVSGRCIREPKDCAGYNRWQWRGPQDGE